MLMKGIYVCMFSVKETTISVGAMGNITLESGVYLYVGSAQKALQKRIKRHKTPGKNRLHWHIDYISNIFPAKECYAIFNADREFEEELASMLAMFYPSIIGFGSSDSGAQSHFFKVDNDVINVLEKFAKVKGVKWKKV